MAHIVVSLGGSILVPGEHDSDHIREIADLCRREAERSPLLLVCGGGRTARYYITVGRELGADRNDLDQMGIALTRLNARLLQLALGADCDPIIPESIDEAEQLAKRSKIVVMGGTSPGHTTDAVSAMIAERLKADRIVNATSVDAAYSADPKRHPEAQRFNRLTHAQLLELVDKGMHSAGPSDVFDKLGAQVALRAGIPLYIVSGRDLIDLQAAIRGEKVKGTLVVD